MSLTKKVNLQFAAVQSSFWITFFPIAGFAVVLLQSRHFTDSEIGIILALQSVSSIIAQPLISTFAGKNPQIPLKKIITAMLLIGAGFASILFFLPHIFLPAAIIFICIGMTEMSAPSLMNAVAMQLTNAGIPVNYGVARGIGSISYALAGLALGKLVDISGVSVIVPVFVIAILITSFFIMRLYVPAVSKDPADISANNASAIPQTSIWTFLRNNKTYTGFCFASIFLFASHSCINNFLPNIMNSLGGSLTDQGITRSLAACVELPIMFFYSVLSRHVSSHKLLTISAFSFFLKAFATMLVPSVGFLFAAQIFQMPAFGLYTPSAVHFSDRSVANADRIRSQAISMVAGVGIGYVIGNLGGGFILDAWGLKSMLLTSTILGFIGFAIMFVVLFEKKPKVRRE